MVRYTYDRLAGRAARVHRPALTLREAAQLAPDGRWADRRQFIMDACRLLWSATATKYICCGMAAARGTRCPLCESRSRQMVNLFPTDLSRRVLDYPPLAVSRTQRSFSFLSNAMRRYALPVPGRPYLLEQATVVIRLNDRAMENYGSLLLLLFPDTESLSKHIIIHLLWRARLCICDWKRVSPVSN
ncbi:hypothetical protein DAEQUDRAFT_498746 [Daedalea quercina L-15889]|uniref:Transposase zinc-binding domain-containing protein n=1 Tax=Daedalea quercina L-15889 TaxID=1314783 RepID=A0A165MJ32_9APHY|nr:hypothetical protein DAEQUDRAFT_498746 [Daedalea quercina L-15889]